MWDIIIALLCVLLAIYFWWTWDYNYWKKCDIPHIKPFFIFGNIKDLLLMKRHAGDLYAEFYWKYPNEPAVGLYQIFKPQLLLRDLDLIKTAFVKEFSSFHDNEIEVDGELNPLVAYNPFLAKGETWKTLRTFHSHSQSSGKIKGMFTLMLEVCKDMSKYLKENEGKPIEAKYFCGQYTTDVVASCAYGIKTNSFLDPNAEFRKMTAKLFDRNWYFNIILTLFFLSPKLAKILRLRFISKELEIFFVRIVKDICEYRKTNNVSRTDFIQTMLDENQKHEIPKYSYEEIAAHTMTFFLDGYETSSNVMSLVIYMLSLYPEHQERLRDEINGIEELSYEEIHKLKFLDAVINETLRMYPQGLILTRLCTKDITLEAGDRSYPIMKGSTVALPVYALHNDPTYFPEPEKFSPDRFYEKQSPAAFVPFGMGPRACVGSRFAVTQIKIGLTYLIQNFKIYPRDEDAKLPIIDRSSFAILMPPKSGLWVKFEAITR